MSRSNVAFVTLLIAHIFSTQVFAQVIRTDSVNLMSVDSTQITKVVSKTNRTKHIALGWQTNNTDSARLYFRLYSEKGTPLDTPVYLARAVNKIGRVAMDFDLAILSTGETLVAWSEFMPATNNYDLKYCLFNSSGNLNGSIQNLTVSGSRFVKVAANNNGFLIAWDNYIGSIVQLFNASGIAEASSIIVYNERLTASANVFEYTNEKNIFVGRIFENQYPGLWAVVQRFNSSGVALNSPPTDPDHFYNFETGDVSFGEHKTVFSFSYKAGTYFLMTSKVSTATMKDRILIDSVASNFSQVAQNDNGSFSVAWITGTQVRMSIFHSSGQKAAVPIVVPVDGLIPSSIDMMSGADSEASIVTAANSTTGAHITLQRYRYQGLTETEEQVVSTVGAPTGKVQSALSSAHTHVAVWQHKSDTQSAIFAQVYDSLFQKIGDPINVTGFIGHPYLYTKYLFDFEAAIDSLGNFMVMWVMNDKDIFAAQFYPDGSVKLPEFKVNISPGNMQIPPRLAASPNGKFVIFWNDTNGKLKARLFNNNVDSGEKLLKEYFWTSFTNYDLRIQNRVAINNRGDFVCIFRQGYYGIGMVIFDSLFTEVATAFHDMLETNSKIDIVMNNNQMVISWGLSGSPVHGLMVQRYDTRGNKIGAVVKVVDYVDTSRYPSLAMNPKNEFVLAYQDLPKTYYLQYFSSVGDMTGERRRIATFAANPELKISRNPRGDIFAVYNNAGYVTSGTSIGGSNIIAKGFFNRNTAPREYYYTRVIEKGQSFHFGNDDLGVPGRYSHLYNSDSLVILNLSVVKRSQTISFELISQPINIGSTITLQATASSGLSVSFTASNTEVASIAGNAATFTGAGTTYITASQAGNDEYNASMDQTQQVTVLAGQTISFKSIPSLVEAGESFTLEATSSSGLAVVYETSDEAVIQIVNNEATALSEGIVTISATQPGNVNFGPAVPVTQTTTVVRVTAIESLSKNSSVQLYPNPTSSQITLKLNGYSSKTSLNIIIMDARGTTVHSSTTSSHETVTLNIEHFKPGLYFIQLKQGTQHTEQKFMKY